MTTQNHLSRGLQSPEIQPRITVEHDQIGGRTFRDAGIPEPLAGSPRTGAESELCPAKLAEQRHLLTDQSVGHDASGIGTGMLVATSPWVAVDLMLVVWRNLRMMQRVAVCFGLPMGQLGRWRLARHVLRNIALAGGTEMAIGALSDSLLSGIMEKLAARIGQGIGVGLYSARLGHFTLDLCRAVPLPDRQMLAEDNRGVINGMRERLGKVRDEQNT